MAESAAESADQDRPPADRVRDLLSIGYIDVRRAQAIELAVPEVRDDVLGWLREFARTGAWRDFESFANLAVHIRPEGLTRVLSPVVAAATPGVDLEDLVEILGEAGEAGTCAAEAVPALHSLIAARAAADGPYYGLCAKAVTALGSIGGPAAEEALYALAAGDLPAQVRRRAAVELGIEEEPGLDAARVLRSS